MATKKKETKKEEKKGLYFCGKKASIEDVYRLLKKQIEDGAMAQTCINTEILKQIQDLKNSKSNYTINVIVPETKPWYKRLFGK